MQRFKLIFHIIYVIIALVIMYFSVDILINTEEYLSQVKLSAYIKFPKYIMGLFLFLSVLMIAEFILQQLKIRSIKGGIAGLENQIKDLKAKLYDRSQEVPEISFGDISAELPEENKEIGNMDEPLDE